MSRPPPTSSAHWNVAQNKQNGHPMGERSSASARFSARHRLLDKSLCWISIARSLPAGRDLWPSSAKVINTPQTPVCGHVMRGRAVSGWLGYGIVYALQLHVDALGMRVWRATSVTRVTCARHRKTASPASCFPRQETPSISPSTGYGGYRVRSLVSQH